ncbi:hypothetical protein ACI2KR_31405 [Pseudomonas luteola]
MRWVVVTEFDMANGPVNWNPNSDEAPAVSATGDDVGYGDMGNGIRKLKDIPTEEYLNGQGLTHALYLCDDDGIPYYKVLADELDFDAQDWAEHHAGVTQTWCQESNGTWAQL